MGTCRTISRRFNYVPKLQASFDICKFSCAQMPCSFLSVSMVSFQYAVLKYKPTAILGDSSCLIGLCILLRPSPAATTYSCAESVQLSQHCMYG